MAVAVMGDVMPVLQEVVVAGAVVVDGPPMVNQGPISLRALARSCVLQTGTAIQSDLALEQDPE